ncbi:sulfite exporter TauE/SafE family protein [bacterium]|nr:sulfite exporter TauE/SafE family protein [candidate division CSSED10-310 bacterium]
MQELIISISSAVWLGILTSISPCPMATNIAAISYIGRRVQHPVTVLSTGILYTAGRSAAYLSLGILIVSSVLSTPVIARFLQQYMNKLLGPVLIVAGLFLLEILKFSLPGLNLGANLQEKTDRWGMWGALPLGVIFALSFCPVSAALFFGSLIPLALKNSSGVIIPSVYGIGTALPVFMFAVLIALGARSLGNVFNRITQIEKWARRITGVIFIVVGIYFSLMYIFKVCD